MEKSKTKNNINNEENEKTFEQLLNEQETKEFGELITGTVITITNKKEIYVDFGYKADGIISLDNYSDDPKDDPRNDFKPGDEISAYIVKWNDGYGNVKLSYKKFKKQDDWKKRQEQRELYAKQKEEEKRIRQENKEKFWNEIAIDKKYVGKIENIVDYGMFVDLGVETGLLHKSEIYWDNSQDLNNDFKVGDSIEVTVKSFENKKISLAYPNKPENPKIKLINEFKIGDVVTGTICKFAPFGAFMQLENGMEGLIHNSEITALKRVINPSDVLQLNQKVNAKIINIDKEKFKIRLSIKEIEGTSKEYGYEEFIR